MQAPYCHLWSARLYIIFCTLFPKGHVFRKKFVEHKMFVLIFSKNVTKIFQFSGELSETRLKACIVPLVKYPFFWSDLNKP